VNVYRSEIQGAVGHGGYFYSINCRTKISTKFRAIFLEFFPGILKFLCIYFKISGEALNDVQQTLIGKHWSTQLCYILKICK